MQTQNTIKIYAFLKIMQKNINNFHTLFLSLRYYQFVVAVVRARSLLLNLFYVYLNLNVFLRPFPVYFVMYCHLIMKQVGHLFNCFSNTMIIQFYLHMFKFGINSVLFS
jgi:hypothetical protein